MKRPSFLTHHGEPVSDCNLPCGFSLFKKKNCPCVLCMDEFTVRIELYKGRRTHKKIFCFPPSPPAHSPLLLPHDLLTLLAGCTPTGEAFSKHRGGGWGAGLAAGFALPQSTPKAFLINCASEMGKVQKQCAEGRPLCDLQFPLLRLFLFAPQRVIQGSQHSGPF